MGQPTDLLGWQWLTPEFIRQAKLMTMIWQELDTPTGCHIDGTHNHFTILDGLKNATAPITDAFLGNKPSEGNNT